MSKMLPGAVDPTVYIHVAFAKPVARVTVTYDVIVRSLEALNSHIAI